MSEFEIPDWRDCPPAHGAPPATGRIKVEPEDFRVVEIPVAEPQGEGEHVWLWVRKREANTEWVARMLAQAAGLPVRQVSFAGRKDRRAVTEQWFSLHIPQRAMPDLGGLPAGVEVLRAEWHGRKLRRGALAGNRFELRVRDLDGDSDALSARLDAVARRGVANYFGAQRFGREGANLARAEAHRRRGSRRRPDELWLSAVRSLLFNRVLAARVRAGTWDSALPGECLMLAGRHSRFTAGAIDAETIRRVADCDLHPSGPLWGRGPSCAEAEALAVERGTLAGTADWQDWLERAGLAQERRPLRVCPEGLEWAIDGDGLRLAFGLPAGSYATVVLAELVSEPRAVVDAQGGSGA